MTPKEFAKKIIASINPGTADISGIGDGTIKGAISEQNKKTSDCLQGYTNPVVIYDKSSMTPYANEDGSYILADSDTGREVLNQYSSYVTTTTVEGNFYRMAGADSVFPFKRIEIISCGTIGFNLTSSRTLNISSILADNGYKTTDITIENVFLRPVGSISSRAKKNSDDTAITTDFTLSYNPSTGDVTAYCGDVSYQQSFGISFNVFVIPTT